MSTEATAQTSGATATSTTAPATTTTTAPATTTTAAPASTTPADWTSGFSDDARGYIANKGFKSAADVLESYRNFEKLQGVPQERILKLPDNMEAPEMRAIWQKLGAPKEAKDYQLKVPEQNGDPKLAEWASNVFFEAGLPKPMAEKIIAKWNERAELSMKATKENYDAMVKAQTQELQKDWGAAFEQRKNIADFAARHLEISPENLTALSQSLGPKKTMEMLYKLGTGMGEAAFVAGRPASDGTLAPQQAKSKIKELMSDTNFIDRLNSGDVAAQTQWTRLHEMATEGQNYQL